MSTNDKISAIDAAIAKAKERQKLKAMNTPATPFAPTKPKGSKPPKEAKPGKPKATDEEKAAKKAARDAERLAKKQVRDAARAEKKAAREAERLAKKAHMSKVDKAAARLPALDESAQLIFNEATTGLTASGIAALAAHLNHFNRAQATQRALTQKVGVGDVVRIIGGDPRYFGQVGCITKAQRIRCFVEVEGVNKDVYLFTSDVEVLESAATTATETPAETAPEATGTEG